MTQADVQQFALPGKRRFIDVPDELVPLGNMSISGAFTGFYNDFVANAEFRTEIGTISTDVVLKQDESLSEVFYEGKLRAREFHIGEFLNLADYIGTLDLDADIDGSGLTGETVEIRMTGSLNELEFMGNEFSKLDISGEIADRKFNGHMAVDDELIRLTFNGILDFRQEKPLFDFTADIDDADLFGLNLMQRDSSMSLDVKLTCNFIGLEVDDLEGRIYIDSMDYREGGKRWFMEHLGLISLKDTGYYRRIMLSSDVIDASVKGNFTYREITYAINDMITLEFPEWSFIVEPDQGIRKQDLEFEIRMKDTREVTDIFIPGLYVEENGMIDGYLLYPERRVKTRVSIPVLDYMGVYTDSLKMTAFADKGIIGLELGTDRIILKERQRDDTLQLGLENFAIGCGIADDSLKFDIRWDDRDAHQIGEPFSIDLDPPVSGYVNHIERQADIEAHLHQLNCQVQVALKVGCVQYINYHGGFLVQEEIPGNRFFHGIGTQGIGARQIDDLDIEAVLCIGALFLLHSHSRVIAHMLSCPGECVEQGGFA